VLDVALLLLQAALVAGHLSYQVGHSETVVRRQGRDVSEMAEMRAR
jgi:hypothetical protein